MSDLLIRRDALVAGPYRYALTREMGAGRSATFIMVNPSTADSREDDHTIRKLYGFSARNAIERFAVVNLFAYRATDIHELRTAADPVGPSNDVWIDLAMKGEADHLVIAAWGTLDKLPRGLRSRWREVVEIAERAGRPLFCFGTAADGHPLHPLTIGYANALRPWSPPA